MNTPLPQPHGNASTLRATESPNCLSRQNMAREYELPSLLASVPSGRLASRKLMVEDRLPGYEDAKEALGDGGEIVGEGEPVARAGETVAQRSPGRSG